MRSVSHKNSHRKLRSPFIRSEIFKVTLHALSEKRNVCHIFLNFGKLENLWIFSQRHETYGGPNTLTFLCLSQNFLSSCHSLASFFDVKFLSYCQFDKMTFFGVTFMVNILNAFRFLRMMVSSCWMFYFYKPIFGNSDSVEKVFIFWWRIKMKYILVLLFSICCVLKGKLDDLFVKIKN